MMDLTNDIIESKGFKRINNSMWRMGDITLQNAYTHDGGTIYERILSIKRAYKVCVFGKHLCIAYTLKDINEIIDHMG